MKIIKFLFLSLLMVISASCSKSDDSNDNVNSIEKYNSLLYGSWYQETNNELSRTFQSYKFTTDGSLVRYTKSQERHKTGDTFGNVEYSEWITSNKYSTRGIWIIKQEDTQLYLSIKWSNNDSYSGYQIHYLDERILNFGSNSDFNKGEKSPNF